MENNKFTKSSIQPISLSECKEWRASCERIHHITNRYFSLVVAKTAYAEILMIDQPETGILGFVATNTTDREWLLQNKPEPGNINTFQLAPTVQATKSNYERVHGGKETPFLSYFTETENCVIDILQSEQGNKFLNKFNRNIKVLIDDQASIDTRVGYEWFTNATIKEKLKESFVLNTDARSVLACGHWHLLADSKRSAFSNNSHLSSELSMAFNNSYQMIDDCNITMANSVLEKINQQYPVPFEVISLSESQQVCVEEFGVKVGQRLTASYFDIHIPEREVNHWQQPLLIQEEMDHCLLLFSIVDNTALFYLSAYPELGFYDRTEFGPSAQNGTDCFKSTSEEIGYLLEQSEILSQIDQSDEGSRFYKNICRYTLAHWTTYPSELTRENGVWLTVGEIEKFSGITGKLTNELRTLLSLLLAFI